MDDPLNSDEVYRVELELEPLDNAQKKAGEPAIEEPHYDGPNRRAAQRRTGHDRRSAVRYEPGSADRRAGLERRAADSPWDEGHSL